MCMHIRFHGGYRRVLVRLMLTSGVWLVLHGAPNVSRGDGDADGVDEATISLIQDAIDANLEKIKSFEIEVVSTEDGYVPIEGHEYRRKRIVTRHLWRDGEKWRQETESSVLSVGNGPAHLVPFSRTKIFDTEQTTVHNKQLLTGEILPGRRLKSDLSTLLRFGYRVLGLDMRRDLPKASSIEFDGPIALVEFAFPDEGVIKLWLNSTNGFFVEKAEAFDSQGRSVGKGQVTGHYSLPGRPKPLTLCTGWKEELFKFQGDRREFLESRELALTYVSVNKPIDPMVFHLDFPPGTQVEDKIKGITYVVGGEGPSVAEDSSYRLVLVIVSLVVLIIALGVALVRRRVAH